MSTFLKLLFTFVTSLLVANKEFDLGNPDFNPLKMLIIMLLILASMVGIASFIRVIEYSEFLDKHYPEIHEEFKKKKDLARDNRG